MTTFVVIIYNYDGIFEVKAFPSIYGIEDAKNKANEYFKNKLIEIFGLDEDEIDENKCLEYGEYESEFMQIKIFECD